MARVLAFSWQAEDSDIQSMITIDRLMEELGSWIGARCPPAEPLALTIDRSSSDNSFSAPALVSRVPPRHESWEGYYKHMWGLDATVEEYVWGPAWSPEHSAVLGPLRMLFAGGLAVEA